MGVMRVLGELGELGELRELRELGVTKLLTPHSKPLTFNSSSHSC